MPYVDSSIVGDENPSELWDGTNLDMTECDGEASEYYTDYVIGDTPVTSQGTYHLTVWFSEEGWSEMTGDSTGEMCEEYDGSYDADNDVCSMVRELVRNDTHILYPEGDWDANNDDPDGEMCEEYEGSYDADEDICWFADAEIVDEDGGALVLDWGDGEEYSFYQYDSTTGSGVLIDIESVFICDDGESVDSESYDDGWEDCEDGSDEPGQGEETSEFECMDGTVIPFSWVNNWEDDCPDGSDEQWYYQDEGDASADEVFEWMDANDDGLVTASEWADFANQTGDLISEEDFENLEYMLNMYDYDSSGALQYDPEFFDLWSEINEDNDEEMFVCDNGNEVPIDYVDDGWDDCGDGSDESGDDGDDPSTPLPVITGFVADNQTLNAPISDFEIHFLSDCDPVYNEETGAEEMPDLNDCTVEFSIPLSGGETDDGVMLTYTDHDADGLVSPGDELTLDWGDYDGDAEPEVYDTWASEYSAQSPVTLEPLPGFGALLAAIGMLGAVLIRVESRNED
jgi:hypothetical protein